MPIFHWTGRTRDGHEISADLEAPSREEARRLLQSRQISVTSMEERATRGEPADPDRPKARKPEPKAYPFRGLAFALVLLGVAFGIGTISPVIVVDCDRTQAGAVNCVVQERVWGLITLRRHSLDNVYDVSEESKSSTVRDRDTRREHTTDYYRLVLSTESGASIRPVSWSSKKVIGTSFADLESDVRELMGNASPGHMTKWQLSYPAVIVTSIFAGLAVLIAALSILSFSAKFTDGLHARVNALAEASRRRRQSR